MYTVRKIWLISTEAINTERNREKRYSNTSKVSIRLILTLVKPNKKGKSEF
jgi:hypothetical protein